MRVPNSSGNWTVSDTMFSPSLSVASLTSSLHDKSNKGVAAMAIKVLKFPFIMY